MLTTFSKMCVSTVSKVQTFLGQICMQCEELAAIRVTVTTREYQSVILKAILEEMSKFTSRLLTASQIFMPTTQIDLDALIDHIYEADCLTAHHKHDKSVKG
jgi:hypothetical protein